MNGHVRDKQGALHTPPDGSGVMQHFVERHLSSILVTEHNHSDRIAYQNDIQPTFIEQTGRRIIVGRQRSDAFAPSLHFSEFFYHFSVTRLIDSLERKFTNNS